MMALFVRARRTGDRKNALGMGMLFAYIAEEASERRAKVATTEGGPVREWILVFTL